jgi:RNA polymerase sigma factor (sigma-70 family)
MHDAELARAAAGGDEDAFAAVYDRYADRLHDFCHSVLRDRDEARDAVQDTFVLAWQRLGQLRDTSKLRAWLFAIARHESVQRARRRSRAVPTDDAGVDVTPGMS